uniref:peptide-methionine (S)-S-oxide reductase n=1 Tax=Prymnesium polylepis TaxID=72548 RepID=A0A6T8DV21_9EUKA
MSAATEPAVARFGMGCFWAPQETFERTPGVLRATAGYGLVDRSRLMRVDEPPSYFSVCRGDGRTEAVEVLYDPSVLSFDELLRIFWQEHDASLSTPGKEDQYRSVIWPQSEAHREVALADVERATEAYRATGRSPPLTVVAAAPSGEEEAAAQGLAFAPAEGYHQGFWGKARIKVGVLALSLLLQSSGQSEAARAGELGTYLVLAWWTWENWGLMVAAFPEL